MLVWRALGVTLCLTLLRGETDEMNSADVAPFLGRRRRWARRFATDDTRRRDPRAEQAGSDQANPSWTHIKRKFSRPSKHAGRIPPPPQSILSCPRYSRSPPDHLHSHEHVR